MTHAAESVLQSEPLPCSPAASNAPSPRLLGSPRSRDLPEPPEARGPGSASRSSPCQLAFLPWHRRSRQPGFYRGQFVLARRGPQ